MVFSSERFLSSATFRIIASERILRLLVPVNVLVMSLEIRGSSEDVLLARAAPGELAWEGAFLVFSNT